MASSLRNTPGAPLPENSSEPTKTSESRTCTRCSGPITHRFAEDLCSSCARRRHARRRPELREKVELMFELLRGDRRALVRALDELEKRRRK